MIGWIKDRWNEFINKPRVIEHAVINFAVIEDYEVVSNQVGLLEPSAEILAGSAVLRGLLSAESNRFDDAIEKPGVTVSQIEDLQNLKLDTEWKAAVLELLEAIAQK